jgi:hypothetical protein
MTRPALTLQDPRVLLSNSAAKAGVPVGNLIRLASEAESRNASAL